MTEGDLAKRGRIGSRDDRAALGLAKQHSAPRKIAEHGQIDTRAEWAIAIDDAALGESHGEPTVTTVVRGAYDAGLDSGKHCFDEIALGVQIAARRSTGDDFVHSSQILGAADFVRRVPE